MQRIVISLGRQPGGVKVLQTLLEAALLAGLYTLVDIRSVLINPEASGQAVQRLHILHFSDLNPSEVEIAMDDGNEKAAPDKRLFDPTEIRADYIDRLMQNPEGYVPPEFRDFRPGTLPLIFTSDTIGIFTSVKISFYSYNNCIFVYETN